MPAGNCHTTSISDLLSCMFGTVGEKVAGGIAGAAVLWPAIDHLLRGVSEEAAVLLPILGAGFLLVRYYLAYLEIRDHRRKKEDEDD